MSIFFSMLEFTFYTVTKKYPPNPHLNPLEGGLPERAVSVQIFEYLVQGREKIRVTLSAEKNGAPVLLPVLGESAPGQLTVLAESPNSSPALRFLWHSESLIVPSHQRPENRRQNFRNPQRYKKTYCIKQKLSDPVNICHQTKDTLIKI